MVKDKLISSNNQSSVGFIQLKFSALHIIPNSTKPSFLKVDTVQNQWRVDAVICIVVFNKPLKVTTRTAK